MKRDPTKKQLVHAAYLLRKLTSAQVTCESDGLCRVGWATRAAAYEIGKDRRSFGYGSTGKKSHGGIFEDYGGPFGKVLSIICLDPLRYESPYLLVQSSLQPQLITLPAST